MKRKFPQPKIAAQRSVLHQPDTRKQTREWQELVRPEKKKRGSKMAVAILDLRD